MEAIGIIAGTKIDTKLGQLYYNKFCRTIGYPISENPQEQTRLQALDCSTLTKEVQKAITYLARKNADPIIIHCNSLSGAIDLGRIRASNTQRIITPLDIYSQISGRYRIFGLIAANCQSTANIEKVILSNNKDAVIIGFGNLNIVNDIEKRKASSEIIKKHRLAQLCEIIKSSGAEVIILGCTHFTVFYEELKRLTNQKIIEPSEEISKTL